MAHKGGLLFTLRKHRKKSIFGACVLTYATHYATRRFREHQIRQEVFKEAKTYGDQAISPIEKPRRLYVILNPAGKGKGFTHVIGHALFCNQLRLYDPCVCYKQSFS